MRTLLHRPLLQHFDWVLFSLAVMIPSTGLIVLYSAGYDPYDDPATLWGFATGIRSLPFLKQLGFLLAGTVTLFVGAAIPRVLLWRSSYILYPICLMMLAAVLAIGTVSHGARRWLVVSGFNLQPSEPMKIALIIFLARYLSTHLPPPGGYRMKHLIFPVLIVLVPMGLIVCQPDLGTALSLGGTGIGMVLFAGIRPRTLITLVLIGTVAVVPAWSHLHDYQKRRVLALFDPEYDPLGSGYHITQSKIAVGSGQLMGKGFLRGTQTQLEFLPEHTTDFIFSVLAEEWGFTGCILVLILYFGFIYRMLRITARSRDLFSTFLVFGIVAQVFLHCIINVGMVVGLLPVVGIPLPLFSYGGSSLIALMFSVGLVVGVGSRRFAFSSQYSSSRYRS